jgi:hypothetical protein
MLVHTRYEPFSLNQNSDPLVPTNIALQNRKFGAAEIVRNCDV